MHQWSAFHHLIAFTCAVINALPLEDIWTWQVLLTPSCGLEEDAKPLPVQSIANVMFLMPLESGQTARLITSLPSFFCSLQRQTDRRRRGRRSWDGERTSEQVLFLWFFFIERRRGENFFSSCNPRNHVNIWAVCVCVCLYGCAWDHKKEGLYVVVWLPYLFPAT